MKQYLKLGTIFKIFLKNYEILSCDVYNLSINIKIAKEFIKICLR